MSQNKLTTKYTYTKQPVLTLHDYAKQNEGLYSGHVAMRTRLSIDEVGTEDIVDAIMGDLDWAEDAIKAGVLMPDQWSSFSVTNK